MSYTTSDRGYSGRAMMPNKGARGEGKCHILQVLGDTVERECSLIKGLELKGNDIYYKC